jgi:lipopolysaccharide transport system ATP-binding protein
MRNVIEADKISKQYRLGVTGTGALIEDVRRGWARLTGNESELFEVQENDRENQKSSGYVWALKDVSFQLKQGETLGIIGKNGAGKSTLLKILSQVAFPTKGSLRIKGRMASLLEVGTGFHPELTGRENVYLNGAILGMSKKEISNRFDEIVAFSGVQKYIDTPVKRYSSGMKVRLGFAVAAHLEPEILVVDEVLAVGDAEFQARCLGKMQNVAGSGRTVIFVSHNLSAVRNLCTRGIVLANGTLMFDGEVTNAISYYRSAVSGGGAEEFSVSFNAMPEVPMQFERACLENVKGEQVGRFEHTEPVILAMDMRVHQQTADALVGVTMEDASGNQLVVATNDDFGIRLMEGREPGTATIEVRLPSHLLKPGIYNITLTARGQMGNAWHKAENCLTFEIVDTITFRGMKNRFRKPAIISPDMTWKIR